MRPVPVYWMELTLLAPTALSAACSKALAFWAAAGPSAGPSMRADTATNVTSTFLISLLPKSLKDRKFAVRLSQVTADLCMAIGAHAGSTPIDNRVIQHPLKLVW